MILGLVVVLVALTVKVAIVVLVLKAGEEDIFLGFRRGKGVIGGVKLNGGIQKNLGIRRLGFVEACVES